MKQRDPQEHKKRLAARAEAAEARAIAAEARCTAIEATATQRRAERQALASELGGIKAALLRYVRKWNVNGVPEDCSDEDLVYLARAVNHVARRK